VAVDHDEVEHLVTVVLLDGAERDLPLESLERAEEKLLPCLSARVERANGTPCATA
jgi:hypothetical protein